MCLSLSLSPPTTNSPQHPLQAVQQGHFNASYPIIEPQPSTAGFRAFRSYCFSGGGGGGGRWWGWDLGMGGGGGGVADGGYWWLGWVVV